MSATSSAAPAVTRTRKTTKATSAAAPDAETAGTPETQASPATGPAARRPKRDYRAMAQACKMLGDATRCRIVDLLADEPLHVGALVTALKVSQPAVSHHMTLLRLSGVVVSDRQGKQNHYSLTAKGKALASLLGGLD